MIRNMNGTTWLRWACALLAGLMAGVLAPVPELLPAARAGVANAAKIYVFPYQRVFKGVPKEIPVQTSDLLKNEIKHSEDIELQKGPIFIPEAVATEIEPLSDEDLKAARKLHERGEKLYSSLDLDQALKSFKAALDKYESSLALLQDFSPVLDSLLMLSVCYYRRDMEDEGAKILVKVIRLKPDIVLDPEKYPPMFRNTLEKIRTRLLRKTRGEAEVVANVEGAAVFFDGRRVGQTPVLLKELVPGEHYVRVEKEGLQTWAGKVGVVSTKKVRVLATLGGVKKATGPLGEIAEALRANRITTSVVAKAQSEGKKIGATFVVLGGVAVVGKNYRVGSFLVKVSDRTLCPLPEIEFDPDLLGASVEVYNMASVLVKRVEGCPDPVSAPAVAVVQTAKKKKTEITAVAVGPAVPPAGTGATGPVVPARGPAVGPATPARGPATPAVGPAVPARGPATPGVGPATPARGPATPAVGPATPARGPATPGRGPALPGRGPAVQPVVQPPVRAAQPVVAADTGLVTTGGSALNQPRQPLVVPTAVGADTVKPIDETGETRYYETWWFWTLIGVASAAVIGGAVGLGVGLSDGAASGGSVTVRWPI
ncbi:MAG: PEGA domain-containing protein [Deltaproteobacteria bacterium]|nr:PEGA domain-containing protein [Deltaproteobacteria bacterium]